MNIHDIVTKFDLAVKMLFLNDDYLLIKKISERSVSHKLAYHLQPLFSDYNVDCEYNGDVDKLNDIKALEISKREISEINKKPNKKDYYRISPDIIIHQRGSNDENLLVIEVKKDISPDINVEFDLIKLKNLTIDHVHNHYNYKLGILIIFGTLDNTGTVTIRYIQNGLEVDDRDKLE
jgi:hypothetical protein